MEGNVNIKELMKKYQLTEKLSEVENPTFLVSDFRNRFFFREDDASCWKLDAHVDYMLFNGITEMDLYLAERETKAPYFFCRHFGEVGEKSEGGCGNLCKAYIARNGKGGCCKHYGYTYNQTDICFVLKLSDSVVFQNEF